MATSNGNVQSKDKFDIFSKLNKTQISLPKAVLNDFMSVITGHINYEAEEKIMKNTALLDEQILNLDNLMDKKLE